MNDLSSTFINTALAVWEAPLLLLAPIVLVFALGAIEAIASSQRVNRLEGRASGLERGSG